jgi:hypothetical protein
MGASDQHVIRSLHLFAKMREANFRSLMNAALLQNLPPHVVFLREGELPDFLRGRRGNVCVSRQPGDNAANHRADGNVHPDIGHVDLIPVEGHPSGGLARSASQA